MRISDWSSDVCSSDLRALYVLRRVVPVGLMDHQAVCHGPFQHGFQSCQGDQFQIISRGFTGVPAREIDQLLETQSLQQCRINRGSKIDAMGKIYQDGRASIRQLRRYPAALELRREQDRKEDG